MPQTPLTYEDVEVLEDDGTGFVCCIGNQRVFIGKYVPVDGTTVRRQGDWGRLTLPRWFVEQQGLPVDRHLSDREVEEWLAQAKLRAATAREYLDLHPESPEARATLERATDELAAAMSLSARGRG
jgi:hypothetical protein